MKKVRCYDPKYLKGEKKSKGYNCEHLDRDHKICLAKKTAGKHPTVFPSKTRKCEYYLEREEEQE